MQNNLLSLYEKHIYNESNQNDFSKELWGIIPRKMSDIADLLAIRLPNRKEIEENEINQLKGLIRENLKEYGVLTAPIKEQLASWSPHDPAFEIGHQPLYMGGASFVFNKISYIIAITDYLQTHHKMNSYPFLFIGDHDNVQNELTITRFPQFQSYTGLELKFEYDPRYEDTPMAYLPLYEEDILLDQMEKIRLNYRELFRFAKIKSEFRPLLEERLELSLDLLYESFVESDNFSDWIGKFWAKLFIIVNKKPLFIVKASDIKLRKLLLPYLEDLLKEDNRTTYINTLNKYHEKIFNAGYRPGLSIRDNNEVPFFYECPNCEYRSRVKLEKDGKVLQGKCPTCNGLIQIDYNPENPDLSDHYQYMSPRVESRSIAINQLLRAMLRVTGGGETTYHAQIIPYLNKRNIDAPIVMKNPRFFYNTPWSEKVAGELSYENLKPLQTTESFKLMSAVAKAKEFDELKERIKETKQSLANNLQAFKEKEEELKAKIGISKNKKLQKELDLLQVYLSYNFGTFQPEKTIQEVSWNWIDLSILTGLKDLYGFYSRRMKSDLPLSSTFWLSVGRYN